MVNQLGLSGLTLVTVPVTAGAMEVTVLETEAVRVVPAKVTVGGNVLTFAQTEPTDKPIRAIASKNFFIKKLPSNTEVCHSNTTFIECS